MTNPPPDRQPPTEGEPRDSILGSLPRSRPNVRSPRRDAAARARKAKPAAKPRAAGAAAKRARATPAGERSPEPGSDAGVEDIARAGVTTAVQVATAGLRFAGRAAGAIRESLERR